jgi:hypothetical protein
MHPKNSIYSPNGTCSKDQGCYCNKRSLFTYILSVPKKNYTMSRLLTGIVLVGTLFLTACSGSKYSSSSKGYLRSSAPQNNPDANNAYSAPSSVGAIDKSQYVPFSRELQMKLAAYNVDVRRVQFYIDQKLILTRALDSAKAEVASGTVRFINGKLINEIVIPAYTPGIIESADLNGVRVSFESGNSFLFVPAEGEDKYVVAGNNWDNGTVEVPYDKGVYKASCGASNSVADVRLVVKLTDVNKSDKKTRTLQGRKLGL